MTITNQRARNQLLGVLFLGVLMGALDIAIVGPALPTIRAALEIDTRAGTWIFTVYVLFNLLGTTMMAKLSDMFGRRAIYILDAGLFAAGSLLVAASPTFGVLLLGRAVQGLGSGGIFPVASAVIGDTFPTEKRGSALGMIGAVFGLAFLIGPILGGVLLLFASWRWLFLINLPIALVVIVLSARLLPSVRPQQQRRFDLPGMAVLALLLTALVYGINQIDTAHVERSLMSTSVWPYLLTALVLMPIFWQIERNAANPVLRLSLFGNQQITLAGLLSSGAGMSEATTVFIPQLLVLAFHVSSSTASFMLLPVVLTMGVGAPIAGRMLDRYGSRVVIVCGTTMIAIGMLLVSAFPANLAIFYTAAVITGLGLSSLLGAPLRYIMLNEAPLPERAAAQGILTLFSSIGQSISSALIGAVAASYGGSVGGYAAAFLVIGVLMLVLMLAALRLKSHAAEQRTVQENELFAQQRAAQPLR